MCRRVDEATVERQLRRSTTLSVAVRTGLLGYAVVHLLLAFVALRLAFSGRGGQSTGSGALAQLAGDGLGRTALGGLAVGFAALIVWQLLAAAIGYRDRDGWSRHLMRFGAASRVVVYGYLAWSSAGFALAGRSAAGGSPESATARLMALPAGPWLVAAVGAVTAGIGIGLAIFGWRDGFVDQLDDEARNADRRVPIVLLGRFGYVAKGVARVVIGVLLGWAAWSRDPGKSGGLDESLYELLGNGIGTAAVVVVAAGIAAFGAFLVARARHLHPRTLTS
jgi:hypothetical protein